MRHINRYLAELTLIASLAAILGLILSSVAGAATISSRVLTPDGADVYRSTGTGSSITVTAPTTNTGSNLRAVYWTPRTAMADSRVTMTWTSQSDPSVQEGTAHHIVVNGNQVRAVTLTKNIIYGIDWVFNVHVWDSTKDPAFTQVAQFADLTDVMFQSPGVLMPFPWRVTTEMFHNVLFFKIWFPAVMAEPAWSDGRYVRSAVIPGEWLTDGQSGVYAGHIPAGGSVSYTGVKVTQL